MNGRNTLEQDYPSFGFISIPQGAALYIEPAQTLKDRINLSLYPLGFLFEC